MMEEAHFYKIALERILSQPFKGNWDAQAVYIQHILHEGKHLPDEVKMTDKELEEAATEWASKIRIRLNTDIRDLFKAGAAYEKEKYLSKLRAVREKIASSDKPSSFIAIDALLSEMDTINEAKKEGERVYQRVIEELRTNGEFIADHEWDSRDAAKWLSTDEVKGRILNGKT